jgi:hypothetical protein
VEAQARSGRVSDADAQALKPVIDNSLDETRKLTEFLDSAVPVGTFSTFQKRLQALNSLRYDKKVQSATATAIPAVQRDLYRLDPASTSSVYPNDLRETDKVLLQTQLVLRIQPENRRVLFVMLLRERDTQLGFSQSTEAHNYCDLLAWYR